MSRSRLELHSLLLNTTGLANVYYQAPQKTGMSYPCILYSKDSYNIRFADNIKYKNMTKYSITFISTKPTNDDIIDALMSLPYCNYIRQYKSSENLYHDVLEIYF